MRFLPLEVPHGRECVVLGTCFIATQVARKRDCRADLLFFQILWLFMIKIDHRKPFIIPKIAIFMDDY